MKKYLIKLKSNDGKLEGSSVLNKEQLDVLNSLIQNNSDEELFISKEDYVYLDDISFTTQLLTQDKYEILKQVGVVEFGNLTPLQVINQLGNDSYD